MEKFFPEYIDTAEEEPQVNQPGLKDLREVVANHTWRKLPGRSKLWKDGLAGLNTAIANVPDGMANGLLVGVNPIHGLYATMAGPLTGGIFSSTHLMIITTTAAASLTAGQSLGSLTGEERATSMFVMVILAGIFQALTGFFKFGNLTRFVSYSVTTGFLAGISVLLILNQLPVVTGLEGAGNNSVSRTFDLLGNLSEIGLWPIALAGMTMVLAVLLPRTRIGDAGRLLAIVIPTVLAVLLKINSVEIVSDAGDIPSGMPTIFIPSIATAFDVVTGALSLTVVILVQGAGVSQSIPNPDGSRSNASRDFMAQGAANIASGLFRGLPVGGSLSATALNVISGAHTRWAAIFTGLWMAVILVVFLDLVSYIVMPALGALLILAGISSIKPSEIMSIGNAGWPSQLAAVTTFMSTLFLPIQAAVGIGVVLSALLYMTESSTDITVVELIKRPDGRIEEHKPGSKLQGGKVTVLDVYGNLFYAAARTLERKLPKPAKDAKYPVVILRLRGHTTFGATLVEVLSNYSDELRAAKGRLYLTGVSSDAYKQVIRSGKLRLNGPVRAYKVTPIVGESTHKAYGHAHAWLVSKLNETTTDSRK